MGLQDILAFSTVFSEARGNGDEKENGDGDRASKKARLESVDPKSRSITTFFGGSGAAAASTPPPAAAAEAAE